MCASKYIKPENSDFGNYMQVCTCTPYTHRHAKLARSHVFTCTETHSCTHTFACACTHMHTRTHTQARMNKHTGMHTHTLKHLPHTSHLTSLGMLALCCSSVGWCLLRSSLYAVWHFPLWKPLQTSSFHKITPPPP